MNHSQPTLLEREATLALGTVAGYLSQRVSDGSQISLFIQDAGGGFQAIDNVTDATVALLQNALADPNQSVEYYRVDGKVGLIFRRSAL